MKGLTIGPVSGIVKIIRRGTQPVNAVPGYELKHGDRVQLGDATDSRCWLMYDNDTVAQLFKPKAGKLKLVVRTSHPPCRTVKNLRKELVFMAFPHGHKQCRGARVVRAAF